MEQQETHRTMQAVIHCDLPQERKRKLVAA